LKQKAKEINVDQKLIDQVANKNHANLETHRDQIILAQNKAQDAAIG